MERVTEVIDGDTFKTDAVASSVRLEGVDAPELRFRNGTRAKAALERLIGGRKVIISVVGKSYGRRVAHVWRAFDYLFVNNEMIRIVGEMEPS